MIYGVGAIGFGEKETELLEAASSGDLDRVRTLIGEGMRLEARDDTGRTLLMGVACRGDADAIPILAAANADLEARDNMGSTVLVLAATHGKSDVIQKLVAAGADLEAESFGYFTAFSLAMMSNQYKAAATLIDCGAKFPDIWKFENMPDEVQKSLRMRRRAPLVNWHTALSADPSERRVVPDSAVDGHERVDGGEPTSSQNALAFAGSTSNSRHSSTREQSYCSFM